MLQKNLQRDTLGSTKSEVLIHSSIQKQPHLEIEEDDETSLSEPLQRQKTKQSYIDQNERSVAKVLSVADQIEASKADYKEVFSFDTFKEMVMTIRVMHERINQLESEVNSIKGQRGQAGSLVDEGRESGKRSIQ
ncbi:hypothetical protein FGO68_gene7545 [Halteria grandinella]|uniref:Uncharacterized protein n=1 Tax=Halteria grandinella TaxID=5974 RepID=A0A8J8NT15_HALGN|nr:hypothetical protein FGO68_gene7545 [Halteria grandinella]